MTGKMEEGKRIPPGLFHSHLPFGGGGGSEVEHSFLLWQVPGNGSGAASGPTRADKAAAPTRHRRTPSSPLFSKGRRLGGGFRTLGETETASIFICLHLVWEHTVPHPPPTSAPLSPPAPPPPTTEEIAGAFAGSQGEPVASLLLCNTRALHKPRLATQRHSEHVRCERQQRQQQPLPMQS